MHTFLFGRDLSIFSLFLFTCHFAEINSLANENKPPIPKSYTVVLDPGHGGEDTGTKGTVKGQVLWEKNLSLKIASRILKVLQDPQYWKPLGKPIRVILTRSSDRDLTLDERSALAKNNKANLFVSIHANFDPKGKASGFETYFLNNTDQESDSKLEQIENRQRTKQGTNKPSSLVLRSVLADAVVANSQKAAEMVQSSMAEIFFDKKLKSRGVKQAMFYVLLDAQVPAILVETAYLSNSSDLNFVSIPENRQRIADGIARGILRYLAQE